jgi:hypothetical protein
MGKLARQGDPLEVGVEKPVHAKRGDFVEIGGMGGLKRGSSTKNGMASIAETVEKK